MQVQDNIIWHGKKIIITRHVSFCILLDTDKKVDILIFVKLY